MYNPATDLSALWRNVGGALSKVEMPTLDLTVAALARAGLITLAVSATAPTTSQQTTAWLRTAVPSNSAEGALFLWDGDTDTYEPATRALFLRMLQASAGQNGVSWWTSTGGAPLNTVGNNGDFAARLDAPNGIYGPKANGAWPADPIPGTADVITSVSLDNTFGTDEGQLIYRGPDVWGALPIGAENTVIASLGGVPAWEDVSGLLDAVFSSSQGAILFRDGGEWAALAPGATVDTVLQNNGPDANPSWAPRSTEFTSGDTLPFHQATAPTGWTKQTALNDYGLRVVSGAVGSTAGTAFSTVFAQTAVGNTTLSVAQMPSHAHNLTAYQNGGFGVGIGTGGVAIPIEQVPITTDVQGGGGSHSHSINLALSYVDVILCSKD
jgi:hypothetical protein